MTGLTEAVGIASNEAWYRSDAAMLVQPDGAAQRLFGHEEAPSATS